MALTQISTAGVKNDAVTNAKLANDSVGADQIITNSVTTDGLADNAVDTNAIQDDAVTSAKIANLDANLKLNDGIKATFGGGNDMNIYHIGGANSYITNTANNLYIQSENTVYLGSIDSNGSNVETSGKFIRNGGVELYHNNVKKIETTSTGTTTTGQSKADVDTSLNSDTEYNGQDFGFLVSYDGGDAAGSEGNGICFAQKYASADNSTVRTGAIIGYKQQATGNFGGGLKFKTQKLGANPMGTALQLDQTQNVLLPNDNAKLQIGASQDLEIYHDANNSILKNSTGYLLLKSNSGINLGDASDTDNYLKTIKDGAVELYYDGSKKLETHSSGSKTTGYHQQSSPIGFTAWRASSTAADPYPLKNSSGAAVNASYFGHTNITTPRGQLTTNTTYNSNGSGGECFSNTGSMFTAPVAGVYVFSFNLSLYVCDGGNGGDNSVGWGFYKNQSAFNFSNYTSGLAVTQSTPYVIGQDQTTNLNHAFEIGAPSMTSIINLAAGDDIQVGWINMGTALGVRSFVFTGYLL